MDQKSALTEVLEELKKLREKVETLTKSQEEMAKKVKQFEQETEQDFQSLVQKLNTNDLINKYVINLASWRENVTSAMKVCREAGRYNTPPIGCTVYVRGNDEYCKHCESHRILSRY